MLDSDSRYELPPQPKKRDGSPRMVGFELEFSGLSLDAAASALQDSMGGEIRSESAAERVVRVEGLGELRVELDWDFLKRKAAETASDADDPEWLGRLTEAAALLVPVEVVCPPIPVSDLTTLDRMVDALRLAGAVGTEESFMAAYGVHINTEIPSLDAHILDSYLRAFVLLQWWLVDAHEVDTTRKLSPYIDLYPEAYLKRVLARSGTTMDEIFADYFEYNPSRNRALDLLPLLAEIDEARVREAVDDPKIKPRPTFHYRLPNCHIEKPDWSLANSWNTWCVVERLATRSDDLGWLAGEFLAAERPVLGVKRSEWVERVDRWLKDRGLA